MPERRVAKGLPKFFSLPAEQQQKPDRRHDDDRHQRERRPERRDAQRQNSAPAEHLEAIPDRRGAATNHSHNKTTSRRLREVTMRLVHPDDWLDELRDH